MMHRFTLSFCLMLATIGAAAGQTPSPSDLASQWQRYVLSGEELSFELPQAPTAITIFRPLKHPNADPPEEQKTGRMYGAYGNGVVYVILSLDNPRGAEGLDTFVKEIDHYHVGRPQNFERDLMLGGFQGKHYSSGSPVLSAIFQFYKSKNHVYVVEATSEDMSKPDIRRFLDSLGFASKQANYDPDKPLEEQTTVAGPAGAGAVANSNTALVLAGRDVTRKALVVAKPEPGYTEAARQNQVTGTVVLKAVFSSSGRVERITAIKPLPFGLTEKAIKAAKNIRFIPAVKDGRYVSQYIQLEYTFNLY